MKSEFESVPDLRISTKAQVAEFFEVSIPALDGWIRRGCPVLEKGHKTKPYRFDLLAVAKWRLGGITNAYEGEIDPEKLPTKERLDWYRGEKERRDLQVRDGELIPVEEYIVGQSALIKALVNFLETLGDTLERDCGITGDVRVRLDECIDRERDALHRKLVAPRLTQGDGNS